MGSHCEEVLRLASSCPVTHECFDFFSFSFLSFFVLMLIHFCILELKVECGIVS